MGGYPEALDIQIIKYPCNQIGSSKKCIYEPRNPSKSESCYLFKSWINILSLFTVIKTQPEETFWEASSRYSKIKN